MIRARLLRLGDAEHAVILTMHHIVTDGWSFGVAARELAALYEAFRAGGPSPLPELPIQYADYATWQRDWLPGDGSTSCVGYWTGQLAGASPLELPTDRPAPGRPHRERLDTGVRPARRPVRATCRPSAVARAPRCS